jgi:hypothetical protein
VVLGEGKEWRDVGVQGSDIGSHNGVRTERGGEGLNNIKEMTVSLLYEGRNMIMGWRWTSMYAKTGSEGDTTMQESGLMGLWILGRKGWGVMLGIENRGLLFLNSS